MPHALRHARPAVADGRGGRPARLQQRRRSRRRPAAAHPRGCRWTPSSSRSTRCPSSLVVQMRHEERRRKLELERMEPATGRTEAAVRGLPGAVGMGACARRRPSRPRDTGCTEDRMPYCLLQCAAFRGCLGPTRRAWCSRARPTSVSPHRRHRSTTVRRDGVALPVIAFRDALLLRDAVWRVRSHDVARARRARGSPRGFRRQRGAATATRTGTDAK